MQMSFAMGLFLLRNVAQLFLVQGDRKAADTLTLLADTAESGVNVDAHMAEIARKTRAGESIDWDNVRARIEADSADLHRDPPPG